MIDTFETQLREHGLSVTAQRLTLLQTISDYPHITADQATEIARKQLGSISRQSVYDTLNMLVEKGLARRIQPFNSPALFEDRVGDNHHHLVCVETAELLKMLTALLDTDPVCKHPMTTTL